MVGTDYKLIERQVWEDRKAKKVKVQTIDEAIHRYGPIDFASKIWPNEKEWMQIIEVDHDLYPNWKVAGTDYPVRHIYCNRDMANPLAMALYQVAARGHANYLLTFDGCLNIRMVRGNPKVPSAHAYGLAIDLNADLNKLGQTDKGFFDMPDLVKCFTANGFNWGGDFHSRKDPMHFSYCWENNP